MTKNIDPHTNVLLAIVPSSKGFGYAVLEGDSALVDWGVKTITGDKNDGTLKHVAKMIGQYRPRMLLLFDPAAKGSRRGPRVRNITKRIAKMAAGRKVKVSLIAREKVRKAFFIDGNGTRYAIAKVLAMRFHEELGHRLPRKRKDWESEDVRLKMFDAVALAICQSIAKKIPFQEF